MSTNGIKKSLAYLKLVKFFLLFLLLENKQSQLITAIIGETAKQRKALGVSASTCVSSVKIVTMVVA
jgi:hypothetical protein